MTRSEDWSKGATDGSVDLGISLGADRTICLIDPEGFYLPNFRERSIPHHFGDGCRASARIWLIYCCLDFQDSGLALDHYTIFEKSVINSSSSGMVNSQKLL